MDPSQVANMPAAQPPPGVTPNFEDPWSIAPAGRIVIYVTLPLMLLVVASRVYARLHVTRSLGADDYLSFAAAACMVSYCGVCLWIFSNGYMGPHQWNVRLVNITPTFIAGAIAVTCLYSAAAMFIKTSLLLFYLRLFHPWKSAQVLIWIGVVTIVLFYLICMITMAVFCNPNQWPDHVDPLLFAQLQSRGNCNHPQGKLSAVQGVFSAASDFYLLAIPVLFISRLSFATERKIGLLAIFFIGLIATGCAIATTYARFLQLNDTDFTYLTALELILGAAELNVGVICSCLPSTLVLYKGLLKNDAWHRLVSYIKLRRTSRRGSPAGNTTETPFGQRERHEVPNLHFGLSKTTGGVMTGLRTFIRGGQSTNHSKTARSSAKDSVNVRTEMSTYSSYADSEFAGEEYHRHLRQANPASTPPRRAS